MKSQSIQLSDLQQIIDYEFRTFHSYLSESESLFARQIVEAEQHIKRFEESISTLLKDSGGEIDPGSAAFSKWEDLRTDSYMIELQLDALRDMRRIFTNSSFVFLISIFEGTLKRICDVFADPKKINPKNINEQSYAMKANLFLSKVVGIELPDEAKWNQFRRYSEIRNAIVHDNASVQKIPGKPIAGQSDRYKAIYEFMHYFNISEDDESAIFYIQDVRFIEETGNFLQNFLIEIGLKAIAHAESN